MEENKMALINGQIPKHQGTATIPFATWKNEDSIVITGQTGMLATANIQRSLVSDNDDIIAQDWNPPLITDIIAGTGFTINLRPAYGSFKGGVKVNWSWTN
jgi:hypothetical protein